MVNKRVGTMRKDNSSRGGFNYRPAKTEFVKRQSERRGGRQFDTIFKDKYVVLSKLAEGSNNLRILPATWTPHDDFAYVAWVHKFVAERGSYLCPLKMKNDPCPLCKESAQARRDQDEERARELNVSETMICWVIDRGSKEFKNRAQLYAMPPTLYKDINGIIYDPQDGEAIHLDSPDEGRDVRIRRTGTMLNTRYQPILSGQDSPIHQDSEVQDDILKYIEDNPIPDCLEYKSESYLEQVISGGEDRSDSKEDGEDHARDAEDEADAEEEEARAESSKSKRQRLQADDEDRPTKRKAKAEANGDDEDEPEPDDDDEEDDDEDDRKSKRRAKDEDDEDRPRRKAAKDDDEEQDEDDRKPRRKPKDEDEDEDRPRRKIARDDDEDRPKRKSAARDDDEDDEKPKKRKPPKDDDDDDFRPTPSRARLQR